MKRTLNRQGAKNAKREGYMVSSDSPVLKEKPKDLGALGVLAVKW